MTKTRVAIPSMPMGYFVVLLGLMATREWMAERSDSLDFRLEGMLLSGSFASALGYHRSHGRIRPPPPPRPALARPFIRGLKLPDQIGCRTDLGRVRYTAWPQHS